MITFAGFSKRFGEVDAVSSLSLTINAGEIVALIGPNGSGKTTSIKAAAGLIHPTSGAVLIGPDRLPASGIAARAWCSFLPQRVTFPAGMTGREVLNFYGALRDRPAAAIKDVLAFTGLNGSSRRDVRTYSGGMTQRLGLAVAILPDAPVLLLDEPTAALDPEGLKAFYELIEARRKNGQTVLFSSHHIADVDRLATRVITMSNGRVVGDSPCDH
ncbi:MAG: ABC transporter ATP-binding protein [Acidobacteria bacterium]|nr:MAG: ABC transporter ATP-binding protein [Acidobacteriota bacterium]